jgi:hypothetical protein
MIEAAAGKLSGDAELLKTVFDIQARFPLLSIKNILLLSEQKPGAVLLNTANEWNEDGVYILKGEKPILLMKGVKKELPDKENLSETKNVTLIDIKKVFDVSQTERYKTFKLQEKASLDSTKLLAGLINSSPVPVEVADEFSDEQMLALFDPREALIYTMNSGDVSDSVMFSSLATEVIHAIISGLDPSYKRLEPANYEIVKATVYLLCRLTGINAREVNISADVCFASYEDVVSSLQQIRTTALTIKTKIDDFFKEVPDG